MKKMTCEKFRESFPAYLAEQLDLKTRREVDAHLAVCQGCQNEFAQIASIWQQLGSIPDEEPTPQLNQRFGMMLSAYQNGLNLNRKTPAFISRIRNFFELGLFKQPAFQLAIALICFVSGLFIGQQLNNGVQTNSEITALKAEVKEMRQMVTLSLLTQSSSSERLRGISLSTRLTDPPQPLLSALLNTLNSDPNVNVRLATVDALYLFSDNKPVRTALIQSLAHQTSPLVQIAVIDLLVAIREKSSLDALKKLLENDDLHQTVKQRVSWGVDQLI